MFKNQITAKPLHNNIKEIELLYPKRISKTEIEFMGLNVKDARLNGAIKFNEFGCISLRKSVFLTEDNSKVKVRPVVSRIGTDYVLYLEIYKYVDGEFRLVDKIECSIGQRDKQIIHNVFVNSSTEVKEKLNSIDKLEMIFWYPSYESSSIELFLENAICYPKEIFENDGVECWDAKTFLESTYWEELLNYTIFKKYGFNKIFRMVDIGMFDVIKNSNYRFDVEKMLSHMRHCAEETQFNFTLESIVIPKC